MRTKLKDRKLPNYTRNEERFNSISHIVGGGISVVVLISCIIISILNNNAPGVLTSIIYGLSCILLYTMSSIYHGLLDGTAKRVMQVLDHCAIYILIAGTYTPICVCAIALVNPTVAYSILAIEWILAAVAATFTAIDLKKYQVLSMLCNLVMGWAVIVVPHILIEAVGMNGFLLVLIGGILYTIGAVLYGIGKRKKYMHCIFHLFVLCASILHALAIMLYVL